MCACLCVCVYCAHTQIITYLNMNILLSMHIFTHPFHFSIFNFAGLVEESGMLIKDVCGWLITHTHTPTIVLLYTHEDALKQISFIIVIVESV